MTTRWRGAVYAGILTVGVLVGVSGTLLAINEEEPRWADQMAQQMWAMHASHADMMGGGMMGTEMPGHAQHHPRLP